MKFDLAISYTWIYDIEFTQLVEKMFQENGLSTFVINRKNIDEITDYVRNDKLRFGFYIDRASDEDENFLELARLLTNSNCRIINEYHKVDPAVDKSRVQEKLINAGLKIPKTIIIPPLDKVENISIGEEDLQQIGIPFIIKPAYYSGGGEGVIKNATSVEDINLARKTLRDDSYLVQQKIYPITRKGSKAWFRVLWFFGKIIPLLWDDETLLYSEIDAKNIFPEVIPQIEIAMQKINAVAGLDYFSSEFALDKNDELFLIDYVNDQCDMRLKSLHVDGVPDKIVKLFISEMINFVKHNQK
ncbi:MAG: hypothetical protein QY331_05075 [Melioribacteraceae bacterium]|nr:hypothetical protein [Melioribacteraceae bacterium]WKZ70626.1 MAG: hypothetical protein QY331_05075 [Melioribacteraceae bacterium]